MRRQAHYPLICFVLAAMVPLGASGCAARAYNQYAVKTPVREAGVIFAADGAGNFQASSQHVREVVEHDHLPLQVVTFEWSHGYGRIIADQVGYTHARSEGCRLAHEVRQFRAEHPGVPVHLLGHSAGSAVVIAALEFLPPNTVDRVVLFSPSMSADYDLRPALHAVRGGLHVFHSRRDTRYLGLWTGILGNSDRHRGPSSGRVGFHLPTLCPEDLPITNKLYQRAWRPDDLLLGNDGKHYGNYQPHFVRAHVLPLFLIRD